MNSSTGRWRILIWCVHFTEDVAFFSRPYVMTIEDEKGANMSSKYKNTQHRK